MDSGDGKTRTPGKPGARGPWRKRIRDVERLVPAFAVVTVVAAALLATLMVTRTDRQADGSRSGVSLVPRSNDMGAGPVCGNCGVIESSVASNQHGAYLLRIRMDDGTVRTVEQRGALAAGSRVLVEGGAVRVVSPATRQG
jgi:hypothetical protein